MLAYHPLVKAPEATRLLNFFDASSALNYTSAASKRRLLLFPTEASFQKPPEADDADAAVPTQA